MIKKCYSGTKAWGKAFTINNNSLKKNKAPLLSGIRAFSHLWWGRRKTGLQGKKKKVWFNLNDWKLFARARGFIYFSSERTMPLEGASLLFRNPPSKTTLHVRANQRFKTVTDEFRHSACQCIVHANALSMYHCVDVLQFLVPQQASRFA